MAAEKSKKKFLSHTKPACADMETDALIPAGSHAENIAKAAAA